MRPRVDSGISSATSNSSRRAVKSPSSIWYNRAGVERVMNFATEHQVERFFEQVVPFEQFLVDDGIHLVKIWLSVGRDEQTQRLQRAPRRPPETLEAQPTRRTRPGTLGGLHPRRARTVQSNRHPRGPVVVRQQQHQACRATRGPRTCPEPAAIRRQEPRPNRHCQAGHRGASPRAPSHDRSRALRRDGGTRSEAATIPTEYGHTVRAQVRRPTVHASTSIRHLERPSRGVARPYRAICSGSGLQAR